jgi:hypothetical protein
LFVQRARSRNPAFVLSEENAQVVAEICSRLDGIPLAIELAAARVGMLSVEQISERLGDSLELLTSGSRTATRRQRTLRGALDWSHELLSEPERVLFVAAMAAPALAASPFGGSPGFAPGNVFRSATANEHDTSLHATGHSNEPTQCQASFCTTTP